MLKISLRPSWILAAILAVAHGTAIAMIALISLPLWLQLIAIAALVLSLMFNARQYALLRSPNAVVAIDIASDDAFSVQIRSGDRIECEVLGSTYVTAFLAVLNLREKDSGAVRRAVILSDSVDKEDFRKLRVWLRWKGGKLA